MNTCMLVWKGGVLEYPPMIICKLSELMAARNLSQNQLSIDLGLAPLSIRQLRNSRFDRIDCTTAQKLCNYFGVSFSELFEYEPQPISNEDEKEVLSV